ncbi:MAG: SusD/RagB family nutrient-binding outer membrane lipoprotein [Bacteroidales bacterium]|nr:SusD/RagB family nutrient-binding outer membrane lipoprotein [Bacteroidales bacterium]
MKLFKYIPVLLILVSCGEWLDVNKNPNSPSEVEYELVLPSGISSVAYVMGGRYQVLGALWSQHWTQSPGASQYSGIDSYDINSSSFDRQFRELYSGALKAFEYIKQESEKESEWQYYLIATTMQAYTFQVLADLYDQIPFSEALEGETGNLTPRYENGGDIYDSLITRLDYALSKDFYDLELKNPGENDLLFGGDITVWEQFANTLKLKIYLRQTEVNPEKARQGIEELYRNEVDFLSVDAAMVQFSNETGGRNPLYETEINFLGGNPNLVLSRTMHSYLIEKNDFDRLNYMFYTPAAGGGHKSLIQGNYNDPEEPAGTNSSSYSKPVFGPVDPVYLMSYSEACFLQAEAIMRYDVDDYSVAKEKYDEAVIYAYYRVLYPYFSVTYIVDLAEAYLRGPYRFPSDGSNIEEFIKSIIIQKWVSLAGIQSLETFFEHNRTHYPEISDISPDDDGYEPGEFTVSVNNVTSGRFPKRLIFPESEASGNPNTPAGKPVWEKIWWDKKQ